MDIPFVNVQTLFLPQFIPTHTTLHLAFLVTPVAPIYRDFAPGACNAMAVSSNSILDQGTRFSRREQGA